MRWILAAAVTSLLVAPAAASRTSSHPGAAAPIYELGAVPRWIKFGDTILIDNHRCPAGQLMELTGGSQAKGLPNTRRCVPHP